MHLSFWWYKTGENLGIKDWFQSPTRNSFSLVCVCARTGCGDNGGSVVRHEAERERESSIFLVAAWIWKGQHQHQLLLLFSLKTRNELGLEIFACWKVFEVDLSCHHHRAPISYLKLKRAHEIKRFRLQHRQIMISFML